MNADKTNYDLLYNPRLVVKDYQEIFDRWGKHSERARASLDCYLAVTAEISARRHTDSPCAGIPQGGISPP
jgi:hypothetical protein